MASLLLTGVMGGVGGGVATCDISSGAVANDGGFSSGIGVKEAGGSGSTVGVGIKVGVAIMVAVGLIDSASCFVGDVWLLAPRR